MLDNAERPSLEENYVAATSASNLRCETGADAPAGSVSVLIASGWAKAAVGSALMRLHSEFSRVPRHASEADHRLMMMQLKTLGRVLAEVTLSAERFRIERPGKVALAVIAHWLDHVCRSCDGQQFQRIAGTPALSAKPCKACRGAGEVALPYGSDGRRLEEYILNCLQAWKAQTSRRLMHMK